MYLGPAEYFVKLLESNERHAYTWISSVPNSLRLPLTRISMSSTFSVAPYCFSIGREEETLAVGSQLTIRRQQIDDFVPIS